MQQTNQNSVNPTTETFNTFDSMFSFLENRTGNNVTTTTNGAMSFKSTGDALVNYFFSGATQNSNPRENTSLFAQAFEQNPLQALVCAFYLRDCRGGQGRKDVFHKEGGVIPHLMKTNPKVLVQLIPWLPFVGSWKDVFKTLERGLKQANLLLDKMEYSDNKLFFEEEVYNVDLVNSACTDAIAMGMKFSDTKGLVCKWAPRKGIVACFIRKRLGMTPKQYRKTIVEGSKEAHVVEQKMAAKKWNEINFSWVPSVASKRYQKAFMKHAPEKYQQYIEDLQKGKEGVKINASTLYPHDLVSGVRKNQGITSVLDEQWKALPNYFLDESGNEIPGNFLPVVDVSGSMECMVYGTTRAIDISIAIGIYLAQHNKGAFHNRWITFSEKPKFQIFKERNNEELTLAEMVSQLETTDWGYNTNLEKVFRLLLNSAVNFKIPAEEMPKALIIISDMQFDSATGDGGEWSQTLFDKIKELYKRHGYTPPLIVFWNVCDANSDFPTLVEEPGAILMGGFSPSIVTELLQTGFENEKIKELINPKRFMTQVLEKFSEKYKFISSICL